MEVGEGGVDGVEVVFGFGEVIGKESEIVGEKLGGVEFDFCYGFDEFFVFFVGFYVDNGVGVGFLFGLGGYVVLVLFDNVGMLNEIVEDEIVYVVCFCGVEGFFVEVGGDVDEVEGCWVKICGDDDVKGGEVVGDFCGDFFCVDVDVYMRV